MLACIDIGAYIVTNTNLVNYMHAGIVVPTWESNPIVTVYLEEMGASRLNGRLHCSSRVYFNIGIPVASQLSIFYSQEGCRYVVIRD